MKTTKATKKTKIAKKNLKTVKGGKASFVMKYDDNGNSWPTTSIV